MRNQMNGSNVHHRFTDQSIDIEETSFNETEPLNSSANQHVSDDLPGASSSMHTTVDVERLENNASTSSIDTDPANESDKGRSTDDSLKTFLMAEDHCQFLSEYKKQYDKLWQGSNLFKFLQSLDDKYVDRALQYWKNEGIFIIHELICNMDSRYTESLLQFLKNKSNLSDEYGRDIHQRTWLHAVARSNCNEEIIRFVIDDLKISPDCQDNDGNAALHHFYFTFVFRSKLCNNNSLERMISLLSGQNKFVFMKKNKHDETPLEMSCYSKRLYEIVSEFLMDRHLLNDVNILGNCFPDIEMEKVADSRNDIFWKDVLRENNRSKLIAYMKDVTRFEQKYVMDKNMFWKIINDHFTFDKAWYNEMFEIFEESCKKHRKLTEILKFPGVVDFNFYQSAPFLALITGHWDLVMPLAAFSRFDVVPYCLLTCATCVKIQQWRNISETVRREANEMHQIADAYLAEIINVMQKKYTKKADYNIVHDYLTERSSFFNGSLTDIGYFSNCKKFLNTFSCQAVLTCEWKKRRDCASPFHKFVFHSFFHIIFLLFLFSVLIIDRHTQVGGLEIFCYLYGLGYFAEEVLQMLYYHRVKQLPKYFLDATNVIDLFGLVSFLIAFVLRCSLSFVQDHLEGQIKKSVSMNFWAYLFLCLTANFLSVRLLYFLSVFKTFGPKLKMIERMIVIDLLPVAVIFLVFILSFGVTFQSLIFFGLSNEMIEVERNSSSTPIRIVTILADILWKPTFTIFEPKYVIEKAEESKSLSIQNPLMNLVVQFLLIMFIIIVSVMLMNMLIALFSQTVSNISLTAEESWAVDRWKIIREYTEKSLLVPPLNIIEIAVVQIKSICLRLKSTKSGCMTTPKGTDKEKAGIHPFTVLFLLKEGRFELLKNSEASILDDNASKMMNLLRNKMENLEEMLINRKSSFR